MHIIDRQDTTWLDDVLLDENKLLRILPYSEYLKIPHVALLNWAIKMGIYTFPTTELIAWFRSRIGNRKAIEISAGHGAIGRALGIPITDSYIQTTPEMRAYYKILGQQTTDPPSDVLKYEANEAVNALKPEVVVGGYVTQKYLPGDEGPPKIGSSTVGVDELELLTKVKLYMLVGNDGSHGTKRILRFPHEIHRHEWIVTRAHDQSTNCLMVWGN